jgi:hypothetical protein
MNSYHMALVPRDGIGMEEIGLAGTGHTRERLDPS